MATVWILACIAFRPETLDVHGIVYPLVEMGISDLLKYGEPWPLAPHGSDDPARREACRGAAVAAGRPKTM